MVIKVYNSLTKKKEEFAPINPPNVGMYSCGMTVYDYAHIGHGRKYVVDDILRRVLVYNGFKVTHVQNITDVGHLVSDADEGEDKLEKGAKKIGKTVWEVADFFTNHFYASMDKLNILRPDIVCKATDHIKEQIELVSSLVEKGFAYDTKEAVYFDLSSFPKYKNIFGQNLEEKIVGARAEVKKGSAKRNPQDFALWFKTVGRFKDHAMHWDSPWGDGFPGWHVECSAMSMKYLGQQFDIHTGGEDHLPVHHPNEIAQSEAATGKSPFVRYWVHTTFLKVDGKKMSKSLGNYYTVEDVEKRGFDPLALRYLFLTTHYKDTLNFTWDSLKSAQNALNRLKRIFQEMAAGETGRKVLSEEKMKKIDDLRLAFEEAVNNDLNTPQAIAILWQVVKSSIPSDDKKDLLLLFDEILGLQMGVEKKISIPDNINKLIKERENYREQGNWEKADTIRREIESLGFSLKDTEKGIKIEPANE